MTEWSPEARRLIDGAYAALSEAETRLHLTLLWGLAAVMRHLVPQATHVTFERSDQGFNWSADEVLAHGQVLGDFRELVGVRGEDLATALADLPLDYRYKDWSPDERFQGCLTYTFGSGVEGPLTLTVDLAKAALIVRPDEEGESR